MYVQKFLPLRTKIMHNMVLSGVGEVQKNNASRLVHRREGRGRAGIQRTKRELVSHLPFSVIWSYRCDLIETNI